MALSVHVAKALWPSAYKIRTVAWVVGPGEMFDRRVYCVYVGEKEAGPKADVGGKRRVCQEVSSKTEQQRRK